MICRKMKSLKVNLAPISHAGIFVIAFSTWFMQQGSAASDSAEVTNINSGLIGCLFEDGLCGPDESCFDDNAFGKCIAPEISNMDAIYSYEKFSSEESDFLEQQLNHLKSSGFTWADQYSQCVMQSALESIRFSTEFDFGLCKDFLADIVLGVNEPRLEKKSIEDDEQQENPVQKSLKIWTDDLENPHAVAFKASKVLNQPGLYISEEHDGAEYVNENSEIGSMDRIETPLDLDDRFVEQIVLPGNILMAQEDINGDHDVPQDLSSVDVAKVDDVIEDKEKVSDVPDNEAIQDSNSDASQNDENEEGDDGQIVNDDDDEIIVHPQGKRSLDLEDESEQLFTREYPNEVEIDMQDDSDLPGSQEFFIIPTGRDDSGLTIFSRNERYDVKKPGPFYPNSANNFFLNKVLEEEESSEDQDEPHSQDPLELRGNEKGQVEIEQPILAPVKDKRPLKIADEVESNNNVDKDFVHIYLNKRLQTWFQGSDMIHHLADELGLPEEAITNRLIENQHVQFRVEPNPQNIDAEKVADILGENIEMKKRVAKKFGVDIDNVLAGHEHDLPEMLYARSRNLYAMIGMAVGTVTITGLLVSVAVLVLIKRRQKMTRLKQNQMEQDEEDSRLRDQYSELCRDWSNTSKLTSVNNDPQNGGTTKNAALEETMPSDERKMSSRESSKDSENSNRADEPTASNMDISTGHMVLAYMEDHLKNKQRLEQEWVALCGYEAEPCATTVAFKAENKKKNRYPDKLPFDHNRVILNALLNKSNSDYINASTVTDHDPRNPPYIVTQGPLSQTVDDFWQMVWEQGCVVIVMLTRIQDNNYQLCHRYWPEEGSEKYNIFEVHLVSEHVWCEDFLVRSVYLKNTRTGETRTVTQFHFRSWPAHGVPASTKALLEFRRKVNKSYRGRSCPIIVHCSDGVGRSGTYILIDMVLNRMAKGCKEIDIAATLEHIRDQRGGMVQTRQQFEFCLMAVAEEVHAILKALPQ